MANQLKMALAHTILSLHELGWSNREIAWKLGIHRETVGRHIRLAEAGAGPASNLPAGSVDRSKPATNLPTGFATAWSGPAGPTGPSKPASNLPAGSQADSAGLAGTESGTSQAQVPASGGFIALPPTATGDKVPGSAAEDRALLGSNLSAAAAPYGTGGPDDLGAACLIPGGDQAKGNDHQATAGPVSDSEPWREIIVAKLQQGLSAQRIWQDLVGEHGFVGGYDSVKRFVRKLAAAMPLPFRRMECPPGHQVQVDFGTGAPIVGADGRRQKCHVFRAVLGHSRKGYSEVVFRQTTDAFLCCLENAFWHIGGVPRTVVIDYVAGHIIDLMCPPPLCGRTALRCLRMPGGLRLEGNIIAYRDFSHSKRAWSSFQTG
jgi:hypothetical protein